LFCRLYSIIVVDDLQALWQPKQPIICRKIFKHIYFLQCVNKNPANDGNKLHYEFNNKYYN